MVFNESNKNATPTTSLLRTALDINVLKIYDNTYHLWDELSLSFDNNATHNEDLLADATKLLSGDFGFYSLSADGKKLTIDNRPFDSTVAIPLGINCSYEQEFIIRAEQLAVPQGKTLYLHDKLLHKYVPLTSGSEYRFTVSKEASTKGDARFELKSTVPQTESNDLLVNMLPNPAVDYVVLNVKNINAVATTVRMVDVTGKEVFTHSFGAQSQVNQRVDISQWPSGIYLVEVNCGDNKVVQKLIKE